MGGKGSIPDPKCTGFINYCGPNGEACLEVPCQSCGGAGWIDIVIKGPFYDKNNKWG